MGRCFIKPDTLCARFQRTNISRTLWYLYAPVIPIDVVRAILLIAAKEGWPIIHVDVDNAAFLNSEIRYEIYLPAVQGMDGLYEILKEIYGLKTSAKSWYSTLATELNRLGFIPSEIDPCIFIHENGTIIGVYIDNIRSYKMQVLARIDRLR